MTSKDAATEIAILYGEHAIKKIAELERKAALGDKAMRALESLTPGGSEYVNDIERCVQAVRSARETQMEVLRKTVKAKHEQAALLDSFYEASANYLHECGLTGPAYDPSMRKHWRDKLSEVVEKARALGIGKKEPSGTANH